MQYTLFPLNTVVSCYAGHQGYTPSVYWLIKAYNLVKHDPLYFSRDNACIQFGVSQSMLKAVAYWAEAFKIIECWDKQANAYQTTPFGEALLHPETGSDPYLEAPQTLWILHWNLLKTPCLPKVWGWFFNGLHVSGEWEPQLLDSLREWAKEQGDQIAESTLKADLSCLIKMYGGRDVKKQEIESALMRPFPSMKLLFHSRFDREGWVELNQDQKPGLSYPVIGYACLDYAESLTLPTASIRLSHLMYIPRCPNNAFCLTLGEWDLVWEFLAGIDGINISFDSDVHEMTWTKPIADLKATLWGRIYQETSLL